MRCAKCHKNEATIHFTPVVNGKPQKIVHLCEDCAPNPFPKYIEAVYRRVTPGEFARFQSDAKAAESFFNPSPEELVQKVIRHELEVSDNPEKLKTQEQEDMRILIVGTDWHALHFLLTGDGELKRHPSPPPPLGNVVQGGTETLWPCTYGHIRSLTPDEVRAAADALAGISVKELRSRFSAAAFNAAKIYPYCKGARWTEAVAETLFEIYPQLVEFFQAAARDGDVILLSSE